MYLIRLPRLGQTMESGVITAWHVAEGDRIVDGEPLYEVETDKITTEVEAKQDGVLARILTPADQSVPVGTYLAVGADVGEAFSADDVDAWLQDQLGDAAPAGAEADIGGDAGDDAGSDGNPGADEAAVASPAPATEPALLRTGRVRAVPKARHLARERGIDLRTVRGSGADGVVRVADLDSALGHQVFLGAPRVAERIPVRGVGRVMADSMTRSWTEIPQFVQQISLDASALRARLKRLRYEGVQVTYTDLLIAATALTAREVPAVNATFTGDEILRYSDVNVSFAVASDRGLLVPVLRQADQLSMDRIAEGTKSLAAKARDGKLDATDVSDGTITVSNLGAFGVETGTPIVNAPQSAIVFVGALQDRAVVENGQIVVRPMLNVAIAYDHRVVDGMAAAQFTSALKHRLEAGG